MPKNSASSSTSSAETAMIIDPEETGSGSGSSKSPTPTQVGLGNTQASPPLSAKTEEIVRGIAFKVNFNRTIDIKYFRNL